MEPRGWSKGQLLEVLRLPRWNDIQLKQVMKALDDSGMSTAAFCREHGLKYWRVANAKQRFKTKAVVSSTSIATPAFLPVTIEPQHAIVDIDNGYRGAWTMEVQLGKCVVRIGRGADEKLVTATLRAVRTMVC